MNKTQPVSHEQALHQAMNKLSQFVAETGSCPHEEFSGWKDCNDPECQKLKGKQPKDKSAWCWRRWSGCPTCNKGFGVAPANANAPAAASAPAYANAPVAIANAQAVPVVQPNLSAGFRLPPTGCQGCQKHQIKH